VLKPRDNFYLVELLACEPLGKLPSFQVQRSHTASAAFLAKQSCFPWRVKRWLGTERRAARSAPAKLWQPAAETHGPKRKITQRQLPSSSALDFANREQQKPEHGLGRFMLWENLLRNLANDRQSGAQFIIALRLVK
jgi:hypothetical protein